MTFHRKSFKTFYRKMPNGYRWQIATAGGTLLRSGMAASTTKARVAVKEARKELMGI